MKDKKMLYGIGIVFLFLASVGFSYAYFKSTIVNKDVKDQIVTTGTLELTYTDGAEIKMLNIKPGQTITKKVTVKNTGTLDTTYNLVWQELNNEIMDDEMVISATCERSSEEGVSGTCNGISEVPIGPKILTKKISIEPGITHKYTFTITFKEINAAQDYNQGKKFNGVIGISEYKEEIIRCTADVEMVQGAEYVNDQYTYRYMQEMEEEGWQNITTDGWGVVLTDKTSTSSVTSDVCTYINDKPVISNANTFSNSKATSIDLSTFNTSNVINMTSMFANTSATSIDLSTFDTSSVVNMDKMFQGVSASELDLSNFDTSNVKSMSSMFQNSKATSIDMSNFNTENVTNMNNMFSGSTVTNVDMSKFSTSNVTNMASMFQGSSASSITGLNAFDTSSVTSMASMFQNSMVATIDLSSFKTGNVTNMASMFYSANATTIKGLTSLDTSKVTDMSSMFYRIKLSTVDLSGFNTSNVTNMGYMFYWSSPSTINLSSFDTSKVTNMHYMFFNSKSLKTIYASSKFVTTKVTNSSSMFSMCSALVGGSSTKYNSTKIDKTYARIDGGTSSPGYFTLKN